ncbi:MAG: undecaprenyl diphosphate synthase family protein, partial [Bacteroidales bacterium]|nr:undecaprenyl diphosphate synthase family protein [Bacteroidales bacterium]
FYFTDKLWPDFREDDFNEALDSFKGRDRRFGKVKQ